MELHCEVDLPRDFPEAEGRIQRVPHVVLHERLDLRVSQSLHAKVIEDVLQQPPSDPATAMPGGNNEVGNVADPRLPVAPTAHVSEDGPVVRFRDEAPDSDRALVPVACAL